MLQFWQVNGVINVTTSDGSRVCIEGPEQHGRLPACWISFQSLPVEIWGGEAYGLFAQQSGKKKALNHWELGFSSAVQICLLGLIFGFLHAGTTCSDKLQTQDAWRL